MRQQVPSPAAVAAVLLSEVRSLAGAAAEGGADLPPVEVPDAAAEKLAAEIFVNAVGAGRRAEAVLAACCRLLLADGVWGCSDRWISCKSGMFLEV